MNDVPFRKVVTSWMADEDRRLRISSANQNAPAAQSGIHRNPTDRPLDG